MDLSQFQGEFNNIINFLKEELKAIRSGRANSGILDGIMVLAYEQQTPLKGVASISVPDARTILVDPWDKSLLKVVEDAIRNSGKGLNPINDGKLLRVIIPQLTEESRKELVKLIKDKGESARISIRQLRDKIKDEILRAEDTKEIAEDARFKIQQDLDKKVKDINDNIKKIIEEKEHEIMTV